MEDPHPVFTSIRMEWVFILKPDVLKQLEGNIQKILQDTGMGKNFLNNHNSPGNNLKI